MTEQSTECRTCKGTGGISKWERVPFADRIANGYAISMDFYERCPICNGTGRVTKGASPHVETGATK